MEAGRFFRFARRLPAYRGAMRARAERLAHTDQRSREQGIVRPGTPTVAVPAGELNKIPGLGGMDGVSFETAT